MKQPEGYHEATQWPRDPFYPPAREVTFVPVLQEPIPATKGCQGSTLAPCEEGGYARTFMRS